MMHLYKVLILLVLTSCGAPRLHRESIAMVTPVRPVKILKPQMVVIDAGHGGEEPGAIRKETPKLVEKQLTLETAQEVASFLRSKGYRVALTRTGDQTITLIDRVRFAESRKADLFVSIHFNSCPKPEVQGIEVYFFKNKRANFRQKESEKVGKLVLENIVRYTKSTSRGVRHGDFCVIRETKMPAILVEGGYLTNLQESKRLKAQKYLKHVAYGIAHGIDTYLKSNM